MAFTIGISLAAGLLFGAIPIAKYARPQMAAALKDSSRGSSEGRERHRARNTLVVAQVALAAVLLVASGLMVRTFLAIRDVPPGFRNPGEVLTLRISIPSAVIKDESQAARTHEQIVRRIEAIPGVQSVGVASSVTMDGNGNNDPIWVEDFPAADSSIPPLRRHKYFGEKYFETMGNPHRGRAIADVERRAQRGARGDDQREPGARVLGRAGARDWQAHPPQSENASGCEIVGVIGDERQDGSTKPAPTIVYWPMKSHGFDERNIRAAFASLCHSIIAIERRRDS